MQLALVVGGEDVGERVEQLVGQANARQVRAHVEAKRREQQRQADEFAAMARNAELAEKALEAAGRAALAEMEAAVRDASFSVELEGDAA